MMTMAILLTALGGQPETPFFCNLKALTPAERSTYQQLSMALVKSIRSVRELPDGYAFELDAAGVAIKDVAAWVEFERRCCPFFGFALALARETGAMTLGLTGREGVKEFIRSEFPPAIFKR